MGANNADFHAGHGFGYEPKIGPTNQRLQKSERWLPSHAGAILANYGPSERKMVRISSIKSMQRDVKPKLVSELAQVPADQIEPVRLWRDSRGLRVFDGNHRINAAIARGDTHINAHIWDSRDFK